MDLLRRYRVGVVLFLLLVGLGGPVWYWTRTRTAGAVTRGRPDPVVGVVSPQRRDIARVSVDAIVEVRTGVLTVPLESLRVGDGRPSVMVVRNNAVEPVSIELGVADAQGVEVLKGLSPGDQVILQGKDLVRQGQKVRGVPATGR